MNSVNIVKKQRSNSTPNFYVYYNEWTGEILSVGCSEQHKTPHPYILTTQTIAQQIIKGQTNHKNYLVINDTNGDRKISKKSKVINLRQKENHLTVVSRVNQGNWDIRVRLFTGNNILTVELNNELVQRMVDMNIKAELKIQGSPNFDFFVVKRNQPDYLLDTIEITTSELLKQPVLLFDVGSLEKYANFNDIDLLTNRQFEHYQFEIIPHKYEHLTPCSDKSIQISHNQDQADLVVTKHETGLTVSSAIPKEQYSDRGLHSVNETVYLVGSNPDQFIARLDLDILKLRQGKTQYFDIAVDGDFRVVHRNNRLSVTQKDTS